LQTQTFEGSPQRVGHALVRFDLITRSDTILIGNLRIQHFQLQSEHAGTVDQHTFGMRNAITAEITDMLSHQIAQSPHPRSSVVSVVNQEPTVRDCRAYA
jgi:hypothetical protein